MAKRSMGAFLTNKAVENPSFKNTQDGKFKCPMNDEDSRIKVAVSWFWQGKKRIQELNDLISKELRW